MSSRVRVALAVVVCGVGVIVAVRAMYRPVESNRVVVPVVESPARVEAIEAMSRVEPLLRVPTGAEVGGVLDEIRERTDAGARLLEGGSRLDAVQARDLGSAFVERMRFLMGGTFDENVSALAARGWPLPDDEGMSAKRENWERFYRGRGLPAVMAEGVEVRAVSAAMMETPGGAVSCWL